MEGKYLHIILKRNLFLALREFRKYATKPRLSAVFEEKVVQSIENSTMKPKGHPGIMKTKPVKIPSTISNSIQHLVQDKPIKSLLEEGAILARHLHGRHPPIEEHELKILSSKVEQDVDSRSKIDISVLSEESRKHVLKIKQKQARRRFHECVYHWQPIIYNYHKGLLYLLGRSPAEFAVLFKIFCEMKQRLPNLAPRTIFDFGSGVGTTTWAAREVWGSSLHEYFNVDCCAEMNNLASLLLRDGKEDQEMPLKGVFYRQFLPASHSLKYDIVVSAYALFELPSSESRLETILALWNKTQAYLVIVEQGTNAGYKIVNEARDFILYNSKNDDNLLPQAHVFAPCPHDLSCPRFIRDDIPCNFEATYSSLPFGRNPEFKKEQYSYIILKKGHRPMEDRQWPRLVSPTIIRHKHAICRMCSSEGKLEEIIFTASRHGKSSYKCARASKWGDLLPVKVEPVNGSQETNTDKIDSGSQETNTFIMDSGSQETNTFIMDSGSQETNTFIMDSGSQKTNTDKIDSGSQETTTYKMNSEQKDS